MSVLAVSSSYYPAAHNAVVGNIDPDLKLQVVIEMRWLVTNNGSVPGDVAARILIQKKQFLQEIAVVEAGITIKTNSLTQVVNNSITSQTITWDSGRVAVLPGDFTEVRARLVVGTALLFNMQGLDVVSIIDDMTTPRSGIAEHRDPDMFSVVKGAGFVPVAFNEPDPIVSVTGL